MHFKSTSGLGYLKMRVRSSDTLSTSVLMVVEFYIVAGEKFYEHLQYQKI